jgi:hypothetical protein
MKFRSFLSNHDANKNAIFQILNYSKNYGQLADSRQQAQDSRSYSDARHMAIQREYAGGYAWRYRIPQPACKVPCKYEVLADCSASRINPTRPRGTRLIPHRSTCGSVLVQHRASHTLPHAACGADMWWGVSNYQINSMFS